MLKPFNQRGALEISYSSLKMSLSFLTGEQQRLGCCLKSSPAWYTCMLEMFLWYLPFIYTYLLLEILMSRLICVGFGEHFFKSKFR